MGALTEACAESSQDTRRRALPSSTALSRDVENSRTRSIDGASVMLASFAELFGGIEQAPVLSLSWSRRPAAESTLGTRSLPAREIKSRTSFSGGAPVPHERMGRDNFTPGMYW